MKVKKETVIRSIITGAALLNILLTAWGKNPLPWSEEEMYEALSAVAAAAASVWSWWKNNSFTKAAITADEYMKELKSE